jgi:DNA-binding MarR family transcriptional regulator
MNNHQQPPAKGVGMLVHDVARLLRRAIDQRASAVGLTSAQWRVLSSVARAEFRKDPAPNQASLADEMDMEPITLSRLIDRMEKADIIERRPDPNDRRAHRIYLKEAARPLVMKFRDVAITCLGSALEGISDDELDQLANLLTRVRNNLTGKSAIVPPAENTPAPKAGKARSPIRPTQLKQGIPS